MAYHIIVSVFEFKANLSRFLRALKRGDCDAIMVQRYGRDIALMVSCDHDKPALDPQTKDDIAMRARARWIKSSRFSRRTGPVQHDV